MGATLALHKRFKVRMACGSRLSHVDREGVVHTGENGNEMALKGLHGTFGFVASMNIRRGEFNSATIAANGGFELARCLIGTCQLT